SFIADKTDARSIRLSVEVEEDLPRLIADRARLVQILVNLLSNAIEFTERGGLITLVARCAQNGGVEFRVADAGAGVTAAEIKIALEAFRQVDAGLARQHQGTGLGLPIARKLTELHGGSLLVDSERGRGTTVTVALPPSRVLPGQRAENSGDTVLPAHL